MLFVGVAVRSPSAKGVIELLRVMREELGVTPLGAVEALQELKSEGVLQPPCVV